MNIFRFMNTCKTLIQENGLYGCIKIAQLIYRKIYNILFFKRYGIVMDPSSDVTGLKYMDIGSLSAGGNCRIEIITSFPNLELNPKLKIGDRVAISDRVHIGCCNYIEIGDDCLFGSNIYVSDHNHGQYKGQNICDITKPVQLRPIDIDKPVIIGKNVWIGDGVAILPGAKIGDNSIIGANAVVTGEIPSNCIAAGVPAKVIKNL